MKFFLLISTLLLPLYGPVLSYQQASAASAGAWEAGRIIDDALFVDKHAMSVEQIQQFLNARVGTGGFGKADGKCDTNGEAMSEFGGGTRAQYGVSKGNPAPFTCLKDYYEVPKLSPSPEIPASNYGGVPIPVGAKSAAQLIWDASQRYNISPKVLLVTIHKESAGPLTTDDWPFKKQYTYAMGAHCPDSGPNGSANCDPDYAGFSIQISESAKLFRYYLDNMDKSWWPYKKLGINKIQYHPNVGCGSSDVNILTRATAALYTYTPYQPNKSALDNLYGSGDSCGAYGNRNFWRIYTDWFGGTRTDMSVSNIDWKFEDLDGNSGSVRKAAGNYGKGVSTVDDSGVLRTFYHDINNGNLIHSWADSTGWHFETLDGEGGSNGRTLNNVGAYVKTSFYNGLLYVAYYDGSSGDIRIASKDIAGVWSFQTLDGNSTVDQRKSANTGQDISMVQFGTSLQLFYSDVDNGNLRHAWLSGGKWSFEDLDGDIKAISGLSGFIGQSVSATVYGDSLQLFYYDAGRGNLRHGWANSKGWHFENLDGDAQSISRLDGNIGAFTSSVQYGDSLQLFYYDAGRGNLRHGWANSKGWHFENLDGDAQSISRQANNAGVTPVLTSINNQLHVFYNDPGRGAVKQAWADTAGWHFAEIDGTYTSVSKNGNHPMSHHIAVSPYSGGLQMFYFNKTTGALRHTFGNLK